MDLFEEGGVPFERYFAQICIGIISALLEELQIRQYFKITINLKGERDLTKNSRKKLTLAI